MHHLNGSGLLFIVLFIVLIVALARGSDSK